MGRKKIQEKRGKIEKFEIPYKKNISDKSGGKDKREMGKFF